jgi:hypothetical protein
MSPMCPVRCVTYVSGRSQVVESTHRHSSIWAHLGAEFRVRAQHLAHFVHCFALRVSDHVAVNPERDARLRVPHLLLRDFWIRARVDHVG